MDSAGDNATDGGGAAAAADSPSSFDFEHAARSAALARMKRTGDALRGVVIREV